MLERRSASIDKKGVKQTGRPKKIKARNRGLRALFYVTAISPLALLRHMLEKTKQQRS